MPKLTNGRVTAQLLHNGAIGHFVVNGVMVNQVDGNALDGSMTNIYLRLITPNEIKYQPLIGPKSTSQVRYNQNQVIWHGVFETIEYTLKLTLNSDAWFWTIALAGKTPCQVDLTYVQDLGLGTPGFVTSNEAYASQYLDHYVQQTENTITIASRQNQPQDGRFPYLQQGAFAPLAGFETDGFQFFGTTYRDTGRPEGLTDRDLKNQKVQYESGMVVLRTPALDLPDEMVFYAAFVDDQPAGNNQILCSATQLQAQYAESQKNTTPFHELRPTQHAIPLGQPIGGADLTDAEIASRFPDRRLSESSAGQLLSFFTGQNAHVVLKAKERVQQRQTGNIVMAGQTLEPTTPVLASTQFMPGIFESHTVFGNTNAQILTTHTRDALNFFKASGTRIYLRLDDDQFHLLGMPSAYVMYYNGGDWIYSLPDDTLIISQDALADHQQLSLKLRSEQHRVYDVLVTSQWNAATLGAAPKIALSGNLVTVAASADALMAQRNPDCQYQIRYLTDADEPIQIADEHLLFGNSPFEPTNQIVALFGSTTECEIQTGLVGTTLAANDPQVTRRAHAASIESLLRGITLSSDNPAPNPLLAQTNSIIRWFAHDALVHLLSPHGLEQYGGAAWGTRDVAQGPTELFMATQHYAQVRKIITTLYTHQFVEDGNWPQWFMFDEYQDQFADESHGDIIVWPLKMVVDYLAATSDYAILDEMLPYMSRQTKEMTASTATLRSHIEKQLQYIEAHFLPGTAISAYGDGDWDDTLQPADPAQKREMASTWTEELTIETLRKGEKYFQNTDPLHETAQRLTALMAADFDTYFKRFDVLPGFIKIAEDGTVTPIIYPGDTATGINYRLLPLSQGVLSHILEGPAADKAIKLIETHLEFPDGVRLMDRPATYRGGVSTVFKRAEQAANFGREIGLLYVHAHIRYAQAVAGVGDPLKAWELLQMVNPIQLNQRVQNAAPRQSNVYFSSSDADFPDRYTAQEDFSELRTQTVPVKGGWRLYSSGPGIFIGALFNDILGISAGGTFKHGKGRLQLPFFPDVFVTWQASSEKSQNIMPLG